MPLDYFELKHMRRSHPAWRLMTADNSPLIAGFLDKVFSDVKVRQISEAEILMLLEDYLYALREMDSEESFPRSAEDYLNEWSRNDRGWLRKFYPPGKDEAHFDLTPASEKALQWMRDLFEKNFIGTESRLYSAMDLLREIVHGTEENRETRLARLNEEKKKINEEILRVKEGHIPLLSDREVRERFIQFQKQSGALLSDFRAVEQNFRDLDRSTREMIAGWTGDKSSLLQSLLNERDSISGSDEGQSFSAFWGFLMSSDSQEELSVLLDAVCAMEAVRDLDDLEVYGKIHYNWVLAGEQTQRTVARLSQQLRRFLDDKSYYENRRISRLLDSIEQQALALRADPPEGSIIKMDSIRPRLRLPMEHPLFSPPLKSELTARFETVDLETLDDEALFNQVVVDKIKLRGRIRQVLQSRDQISLAGLLKEHPLEEGLAELIAYLSIAEDTQGAHMDEEQREEVRWSDRNGQLRRAMIPLILFTRSRHGRK